MIHLGEGSKSTIISKGISAGKSQNTYRGLVEINRGAEFKCWNFTQCDSLLVGQLCGAHTVPYIVSRNPSGKIEHEATTSRISEQLFYCLQRGISEEDVVSLIVNGFCKEVMKELPMEFAVEAQN